MTPNLPATRLVGDRHDPQEEQGGLTLEESAEMMLGGCTMGNQLPWPKPPTPLRWLWDESKRIWGHSSKTEPKGPNSPPPSSLRMRCVGRDQLMPLLPARHRSPRAPKTLLGLKPAAVPGSAPSWEGTQWVLQPRCSESKAPPHPVHGGCSSTLGGQRDGSGELGMQMLLATVRAPASWVAPVRK